MYLHKLYNWFYVTKFKKQYFIATGVIEWFEAFEWNVFPWRKALLYQKWVMLGSVKTQV